MYKILNKKQIEEFIDNLDHNLSLPPLIEGNYDKRYVAPWGSRYTLKNDLHRLDGPAVEFTNGDKVWYQKGKLHRENGPSNEYHSGNNFWYIHGSEYHTEHNYWKALKKLSLTP